MTDQHTEQAQAIDISEVALCLRWKKSQRTLLNYRKAGRAPAHFRRGKEIRYLMADIVRYEIEHP